MQASMINFKETRSLQISIVFLATVALQRTLHFTHSGWIGFAVMMIYAGFDSGTSLHRAVHRFWGAVLGLFLSYILFFFIRFNDDIIWLVVPCILFMAYYTLSKYYVSPTIFTVTLTALGADYYSSSSYAVDQFFFDYGRSTMIGMAIIMIFDAFIFRKQNLTEKFYREIQSKIMDQISKVFAITKQSKIHHAQFLKESIELNNQIAKFDAFLKTIHHNHHFQSNIFDPLSEFHSRIEHLHANIHQLYAHHGEHMDALYIETERALKTLFKRFSIDPPRGEKLR